MDEVGRGLRPHWPPNSLSQGLVDELRGPVELCWSRAPEERPTMLEVQRALQPEEGMSWVGCCDPRFILDSILYQPLTIPNPRKVESPDAD